MMATRTVSAKFGLPSLRACPSGARCVSARAEGKKSDMSEQVYERTERVVADLKDKWDKTEEKPAAIGFAVVGTVVLYILAGLVNALESLPVIAGVFKLVGIFVTGWFTYRYLIFSPDREELKQNVESFWKKVQGK